MTTCSPPNCRVSHTAIKPEPTTIGMTAMALVARAFRFEVDDRAMLERQLDLFTRVAAQVPVRRLFLPDGLDRVAEIRCVVPGCVRA